ncbi:FkbM family methyltransferase [Microcoleus sp. FACHB-1515]|uniref:FkbM family methyltransferase n=1 Tax=Cyanophyceae TaxID=3028117 RepID=UPI001685B05D|nr:FkbM family methyltransferase [Microcoleus sp. FACHB-1515]MBD2092465.1 FkbM family methyltransferase [Microcoleus sp. FACHB-1515]
MCAKLKETVLPNGMTAFCLRKEEVPLVYQQVQEYLKNGIELNQGDTVFDVGANIGLFSLYLYQKLHFDLNIYAFEPIPVLYEVLKQNAERLDTEQLKVFPFGLSQERKSVMFGYHPNASPLSTAYPEDSIRERDKLKQAVLSNFSSSPAVQKLKWFPPFLRSWMIDRKLNQIFQFEQVHCELKTLSEVMVEQKIKHIDLLKVDVERSELDVLLGIKVEDWPKIKQVVVEVHDLENRIEKVTTLLKKHGFRNIVVEQELMLKGSDIFNIYASNKVNFT